MFRNMGIGIAGEEQKKIWTRLYRGDKSRSEHGLGIHQGHWQSLKKWRMLQAI